MALLVACVTGSANTQSLTLWSVHFLLQKRTVSIDGKDILDVSEDGEELRYYFPKLRNF